MAKRDSSYPKDLERTLKKIARLPVPSRKQERRQTATNKAGLDPYLVGITAKAEGKDPIKAIAKAERAHVRTRDISADAAPRKPAKRPKTLAGKVDAAMAARKARNIADVAANEARIAAAREPKPLPDELPASMAPKLRKRKKGEKPSIFALIYAFRAFQQFSYAHTRYHMGSCDESYYLGLKDRFHSYMKELGLADHFDWQDF